MENRMTAQQLKNSILQMAVQGKLVPQDPNDEPASVLLERIRKEKEQLIKDGKIKKNKKESYIFRGADNLHYEQIGKEVRCIEDELPFEIPDSWEWCKLNSATKEIGDIDHKMPQKIDGKGYPYISPSDFTEHGIDYDNAKQISYESFSELSRKMLPEKEDIIFPRYGTIGKIRKIDTNRKILVSYSCCVIKPISKFVLVEYLYLVLLSPFIKKEIDRYTNKTTQPNVGLESIKSFLFPLPPISEQKRIVNKIKKLEPLIEKYKQAEEKLHELNSNIKEQLKKSILQYAIEGKLVPQDPNDEPASVLLDRIRKEKQKLITEGKIKKDKNESIIYRRDNSYYEKCGSKTLCIDEEIPFEIPNDWGWIRLGKLTYNHGQKKPNCDFCYIDIGSINNKLHKLNENEVVINVDKAPSRARKIVEFGDILYATVRPYLHNMCIMNRNFSLEPIASTGFAVLTCHSNYLNEFLFMYMMSPVFDQYANKNENSRGVAYPAINDSKLRAALIPVPSVLEQHKIIDKYKSLMNILS